MSEFMSFLKIFSPATSLNNNADTQRQALTRLKFIGTLTPNEKIDSRTLQIESNSYWTSFKRTFLTGDSRKSTLLFFSSTIDRSFEIIAAHLHSKDVSDQIFCANILQDLILSINGLEAAKKTYSEDKLFVCELKVLIENITAKLFQYQKSHPQLFTIKELCVVQIRGTDNKELILNENKNDIVPRNESRSETGRERAAIPAYTPPTLPTVLEADEPDSDD
jgi:hypothetical protein